MTNKGRLYLIPSPIADESLPKIVTSQLQEVLPLIQNFLTENVRTSRRYLSSLKIYPNIEDLRFQVLNKDTRTEDLQGLFKPLFEGSHLGVMSEAGCPGVADPGALAVHFAHDHGVEVIPLVGPSSILLALMASGLNGQKFAFHGYLPIEKDKAAAEIRNFETESRKKSQTQIFIETPYRNQALFDNLIKNLHPDTLLSIAIDITGLNEKIVTKPAKSWKQASVSFDKTPAVFLFLA